MVSQTGSTHIDTCFTTNQTKEIFQRLKEWDIYKKQIDNLESELIISDSLIGFYKKDINICDKQQLVLKMEIELYEKRVKKLKFSRSLFMCLTGIISVIYIFK